MLSAQLNIIMAGYLPICTSKVPHNHRIFLEEDTTNLVIVSKLFHSYADFEQLRKDLINGRLLVLPHQLPLLLCNKVIMMPNYGAHVQ